MRKGLIGFACLLPLLLVAQTKPAATSKAEPADGKSRAEFLAAKYTAAVQAEHDRKVAKQRDFVEQYGKSISTPEGREFLESAKRELKALESLPVSLEIPLTTFAVDNFGKCPYTAKIIQILDDQNMLVEIQDKTIMARGFPTKGLVDGQTISFATLVAVTGTTRYSTAIGSSNTVFLLENLGPQISPVSK